MSLHSRTLFESELLHLRQVLCCPSDLRCSGIEYPLGATLVLPLSGVFIKHLGASRRVVCDAQHAVFFNSGEPYRVSHPVPGGDVSLAVHFSDATLNELLEQSDGQFGVTHSLLSAPAIAIKRVLSHRLANGWACSIETDETVLELFRQSVHSTAELVPVARTRRESDLVEATKITLATMPYMRWTLSQLARRVYSSPYHLARIFRRRTGLSIHQYHLQARLTRTLDDVLDSSTELSRIAVDAGFSSHSHFTAAFRKAFGATPLALRRRCAQAHIHELRKILTAL